jgi:hypothetical protein
MWFNMTDPIADKALAKFAAFRPCDASGALANAWIKVCIDSYDLSA